MINLEKFRKIQTIISISIFLFVFFLCWFITKFDLKEIQLSFWGINEKTRFFWNGCLILLSSSIFYNVFLYIKDNSRIQYKKILQILFFIVSFALFLTGAIDMNNKLHDLVAKIYFLFYPLAIFSLAFLNRKILQYKSWLTHIIMSVTMIVFPLLFLNKFHGLAVSETIHSSIVIMWNLWILFNEKPVFSNHKIQLF